jgi:DNA replication protein DnaC
MNMGFEDSSRELACGYLLESNARDGEILLRHRALCRECPGLDHCKEHGWIMQPFLEPGKKIARLGMGPCLLRKKSIEQRKTEKLFLEAEIPPSLRRCSLANYVTDGRNESVRRAKFAAENAIQTGCSLVLAGRSGTGKTHLAAAIAQGVLLQGRSALFISAIGYLEHLKSTFETRRADLYPEMVNHVKSVNCLVLDDFGAEKPSEWSMERLYDVINTRIERELQTVITTNFASAPDLIRRMSSDPMGAARIVSRLVSFGWLSIEDGDYRIRLRQQENALSFREAGE